MARTSAKRSPVSRDVLVTDIRRVERSDDEYARPRTLPPTAARPSLLSFVCFCPSRSAQLADRHHGPTRFVRQQTKPAVGHERSVDSTGETDVTVVVVVVPDARRPGVPVAHVSRVPVLVPVPVTGTAEHVARAHRRVPADRTRVLRRRRPGEPKKRRHVRVFAGHRPQLRHVVGGRGHGPQTVAESAAGTSDGPDGRRHRTSGGRHEEVRVRLVRDAARARQTARVPDEHAGPNVARTVPPPSAAPSSAARNRRPNTGGTFARRAQRVTRKRSRVRPSVAHVIVRTYYYVRPALIFVRIGLDNFE